MFFNHVVALFSDLFISMQTHHDDDPREDEGCSAHQALAQSIPRGEGPVCSCTGTLVDCSDCTAFAEESTHHLSCVQVVEIPVPVPTGEEVLIRVERTPINPSGTMSLPVCFGLWLATYRGILSAHPCDVMSSHVTNDTTFVL